MGEAAPREMEAKLDKCLFKGIVKEVFKIFIAVQQIILKLCGLKQQIFLLFLTLLLIRVGRPIGIHPKLQN